MTSGLHLSSLCCLQTALKSLMTMHRLMRESDISFLEEVRRALTTARYLGCCQLC